MSEVVAYRLLGKSGLPSASEKAGLVVDQVIGDPAHVDYWTMASTEDGEQWVDVDELGYSAEQISDLYRLLDSHLHACREGRCSEFLVEDWDEGHFRVSVALLRDDEPTRASEGGPVPPYAAEASAEAQRALAIRVAKWSVVAALVLGAGYLLLKKGR